MSYAELWRRLGVIAERLRVAQPSYGWVRSLAQVERRRARAARQLWGDVAADVAAGLVKRPLFRVLEHMEDPPGGVRRQRMDETD